VSESANHQEFQDKDASNKTTTSENPGTSPNQKEENAPENSRVEEFEAKVQEWENRYKYLYAEFENYKKRAEKERIEQAKYGWEPLAHDLLQVIDNMELALSHAKDTDKGITEGLHMVLELFKKSLEKRGIEKIETDGKPFDPNFHEAVAQEPSDEHEDGKVIREHAAGYTMHGRLLRPARVVISGGNSSKNASIEQK